MTPELAGCVVFAVCSSKRYTASLYGDAAAC